MVAARIRYFRDCYEADNRRATLSNIFASSVEHRLFFEGQEELLNGDLPHSPVDPVEGQHAMARAQAYRKEKDLLYCSLFAVGRLDGDDGKAQPLCAPLLMVPAAFVQQEPHVFVRPDLAALRVNHLVLKHLEPSTDEGSLSEHLAEILARGALTADAVLDLAALLDTTTTGIDVSGLYTYPTLVDERALRALLRAAQKDAAAPVRVVPASCVALVKKSVETRWVLNELAALADAEALSKPLQVLLTGAPNGAEAAQSVAVGRVPAVLSAAQQRVVQRAAATPVTLVVGPPGTGKSYTIAALALEHLSRGQTVLIASKMNHAVDVVGTKIEQALGGETVVVRGGRRQYLRDLKRYLDQLLSGMHVVEVASRKHQRHLEKTIKALDRQIEALERRIRKQNRAEAGWGPVLAYAAPGVWQTLRGRFVRWQARRAVPLWHHVDRLEQLLQARIAAVAELLQVRNQRRLAHLLKQRRPALVTFLKGIRARLGSRQDAMFEALDFSALLQALPVWLVNLADVHRVLPLQRDLFDLAIIDEATQCDIASCLPLLQRARRLVITGDPNQLRHLSFLAKDRQRAFQDKHGLPAKHAARYDYREKSILDFVNDGLTTQDDVVFLNEHFRSVPSIIAFSNAQFYAGSLRVMTERPNREGPHPFVLVRCTGQRDADGINHAEAGRLIDDVAALVEEQATLSSDLVHSIGILSPFRGQVDYLAEQLAQRLPPGVWARHRLLIGTAHTFQGEERDVMLLSFVVDPMAHAATLRFLNRPDVFNVAITRARIEQRLYTSLDAAHLPVGALLRAYLHTVEQRTAGASAAVDTPALAGGGTNEVRQALEARGFQTWAVYPIAGLTMDVVAAKGQRSCGIDLVGFPGPFAQAFPLERYTMFYRAGLRLVPLPFSKWHLDREACLDAIERAVAG